jgi:GrpB-like predicted nucleotidyltransferase (UPF0157 family)
MALCEELEQRVWVAEYDPAWPEAAAQEAAEIVTLLDGAAVEIEHVGSTAVKGMHAKPLIDLAVAVEPDRPLNNGVLALEARGYRLPQFARTSGLYLVGERAERCFSIHIIEEGGSEWRELVATRDYLRAHPEEARAYSDEKQRILAGRGNEDPRMYSGAKSDYVRALTERSVAWAACR